MSRRNPIPLTAKAYKFVQKRLATGRFESASKVLEDALKLQDVHERSFEASVAEINAAIDRGRADIRAGRVMDLDAAAVEGIKQRGRARLAAERRRKSA